MIFDYLYYRNYLFFERQQYRRNPRLKAIAVLVGLLTLNVYTVLSIVRRFSNEFAISSLAFISIPIVLIVLMNLIISKKVSDSIVSTFKSFTKKQLLTNRIAANAYVIASIVLFFVFMSNLQA